MSDERLSRFGMVLCTTFTGVYVLEERDGANAKYNL